MAAGFCDYTSQVVDDEDANRYLLFYAVDK
jgi:hypothetical protein